MKAQAGSEPCHQHSGWHASAEWLQEASRHPARAPSAFSADGKEGLFGMPVLNVLSGCVKKGSESVHRLCEKQCCALPGTHLTSQPQLPGYQVYLSGVSVLGCGQFGHREEAVTSVWSHKGQSILAIERTVPQRTFQSLRVIENAYAPHPLPLRTG